MEFHADTTAVATRSRAPACFATLDSRVDYEEISTGARRSVRLVVPPVIGKSDGRVSIFGPMGRALFGLRAGSVTEVMLPNGDCSRLRVVAVCPRSEED